MNSLVTLLHCRRFLHRLPVAPAPFRSRPKISPAPFRSFHQTPRRPKPSFPQILNPKSCVTFAAAALVLWRVSDKPAVAAPNPPPAEESDKEWMDSQEDRAREFNEQLANNPNDVKVLAALLKVRYYTSRFPEALNVVNRLIELEPDELKWLVWRGYVFKELDESESARNDFERVIEKDPFRFSAYQGLVHMIKPSETDKLEAIQKRVEGVLKIYKERIRNFKMLMSETKFMKGCYSEALNDLHELLWEDPKDFSPRLLLGHLCEDLGNTDEADKQYEICGTLEENMSYFGIDDTTTDSK